VIDLTMDFA